jgi:hypothetical protein
MPRIRPNSFHEKLYCRLMNQKLWDRLSEELSVGELSDRLSMGLGMSLLRFIDGEGREQSVSDIIHLYELILARQVDYATLVWDDDRKRWVEAHDHAFFRRLQEAASQGAPPISP